MFYRTEDGHGLKYNPFKAIIAPRPIGWISTVGQNGVANLAPYSFFQAMQDTPPVIGFASARFKNGVVTDKDSIANIRQTKEFAVNIVSYDLRHAMNTSSAPVEIDIDEFETSGLTKMASQVVDVPLVAEAPVSLECRLRDIIALEATDWVMGDVVAVHINDDFIRDGMLDLAAYQPLARLGYKDYCKVDQIFELERPEA
ncbi:MAG: flavin reductase family protein [Pseudomonadota bacterium]